MIEPGACIKKCTRYVPDTIEGCFHELSDASRKTAATADAAELILREISAIEASETDKRLIDNAQVLAGMAAFHAAHMLVTLDMLSMLWKNDSQKGDNSNEFER